jgi:hypothetical protein
MSIFKSQDPSWQKHIIEKMYTPLYNLGKFNKYSIQLYWYLCVYIQLLKIDWKLGWVSHACNSNYVGDRKISLIINTALVLFK